MDKDLSVRLFVGIPVSEEFKNRIADWIENMNYLPIKWIPAENYHITLAFIGKTHTDQILRISDKVAREISYHNTFELPWNGFRIIRKKSHIVMIWAVYKTTSAFSHLHQDIHQTLNIQSDYPPNPHITLSRIKKPVILPNEIESQVSPKMPSLLVKHVNLYQSLLTPDGAVYNVVRAFELKNKND